MTLVEWSILAVWTLYLLRTYLNLDPTVLPGGREYLVAIYAHFMWDDARACGACAMWFGHVRGGHPAFVDPHEAMLHPVVIATTLIWGTLNGAKMALIVLFFLAGIAQWCTARVLGLGMIARVWSGAMAIAAGNLSGRMENGIFGLITSAAAWAFILPPLIHLARTGSRRSAALLGIAIGLLLISGQAYLQIGVLLISPLAAVLFFDSEFGIRILIRRLALAAGIGVLIAAPLLIPFLHFSSEFVKFADATFTDVQSARYAPLNLVIGDADYYRSPVLGMLPYPYLYTIYVGWIAVGLALIGIAAMWIREQRWQALSFVLVICGAFFVSGATPFRWLRDATSHQGFLHEFALGVRHPTLISGLVVPVVLTCSAVGLDAIIRSRQWRIFMAVELPRRSGMQLRRFSLDPRWLLAIPLLGALMANKTFDDNWLITKTQPMAEIQPVIAALRTEDLQWVATPYGSEYYVGQAIQQGLKLSTGVTVWHWEGRDDPVPVLLASRDGPPPDSVRIDSTSEIPVYRMNSAPPYAAIRAADGSIVPCVAHGRGGNIDVTCSSNLAGTLVVQENDWSGWSAKVNGDDIGISTADGQWLSVPVEAGESRISFRYRPWDVPLGIGLALIGWALAGYIILRRDQPAPTYTYTQGPV